MSHKICAIYHILMKSHSSVLSVSLSKGHRVFDNGTWTLFGKGFGFEDMV